MKIQTVRIFEDGDIITDMTYVTVAIRWTDEDTGWTVWNQSNRNGDFSDDEANRRLDNGRWKYVGNRVTDHGGRDWNKK